MMVTSEDMKKITLAKLKGIIHASETRDILLSKLEMFEITDEVITLALSAFNNKPSEIIKNGLASMIQV